MEVFEEQATETWGWRFTDWHGSHSSGGYASSEEAAESMSVFAESLPTGEYRCLTCNYPTNGQRYCSESCKEDSHGSN